MPSKRTLEQRVDSAECMIDRTLIIHAPASASRAVILGPREEMDGNSTDT